MYGKGCLPAMERCITAGRLEIIDFFEDVRVVEIPERDVRRHPATRMSPEDVRGAESRLDIGRLVEMGVAGAAVETFAFPASVKALDCRSN